MPEIKAPWAPFFGLNNMLETLLGLKQRMSHTFVGDTRVPVTWLKVGPCVVTQVKTRDKDGYFAVQIGFAEKKLKTTSKPLLGHLKNVLKNGLVPRYLREVRLNDKPNLKVGDVVKLEDIFKEGDLVRLTGTSKGKGFAGVVKRWGFSGGPRTHGQSDRERAPGSIGQGTTPGRVWKGKKMAGRMGNKRVTVKNLTVVEVDKENSLIAVSGSVPGKPGELIVIKKIGEGRLGELMKKAVSPSVQQEEISEQGQKREENSDKSLPEQSL